METSYTYVYYPRAQCSKEHHPRSKCVVTTEMMLLITLGSRIMNQIKIYPFGRP